MADLSINYYVWTFMLLLVKPNLVGLFSTSSHLMKPELIFHLDIKYDVKVENCALSLHHHCKKRSSKHSILFCFHIVAHLSVFVCHRVLLLGQEQFGY